MNFRNALVILTLLFSYQAEAQEVVRVEIDWEYSNLHATMELYEPKGRPRLWETETVDSIESAPVTKKIEGSRLDVSQGERRRFVLVMENRTNKSIYFFAAPHQAMPPEHSLGFKFKCLCINHAYEIKPGKIWYRVVELRLSKGLSTNNLKISHLLTGLDAEQAEPFLLRDEAPDL